MGINHWPEDERPREKLLHKGPGTLSNAELLAIFLRTGVPGKSAVDLAHELLSSFGSLKALLDADRVQFCQRPGLGDAKYAQLQAVLEMAKRHFIEILQRGDVLSSPSVVHAYLKAQLCNYDYEVFGCLFLDNQNRVIQFEELFRGTLNGATVYPREVAKRALYHNAAAVILAHNHPSGVKEPSIMDRQLTQRLLYALALLEIRVLDHLIIGDGEPFSFMAHGLL